MAISDTWFRKAGERAELPEITLATDATQKRNEAAALVASVPELELKRDALALRVEEGDADASAEVDQIEAEILLVAKLARQKRAAADELDRKAAEFRREREQRQDKRRRGALIKESAARLASAKRIESAITTIASELALIVGHNKKVFIGFPGGANVDVQARGLLHANVLMAAIEQELARASRRSGIALPGAKIHVQPDRWPGFCERAKSAHEFLRAALSDNPPPVALIPALPASEVPPPIPAPGPGDEHLSDGLEEILGLTEPADDAPSAVAALGLADDGPATVPMRLPENPPTPSIADGVDFDVHR